MHNKSAFSLIELMVVVAIISILTIVAVPIYKQYSVSAKFSSLVPAVKSVMQDAIDYANSYGYFPNASQLNLNSSAGKQSVSQVQKLNPYFRSMFIYDLSTQLGNAAPCGQAAAFGTFVNGQDIGLGANSAATFDCLLAHRPQGTIETLCVYSYSTKGSHTVSRSFPVAATSPSAGDILPGVKNMYGPNSPGTSYSALASTFLANTTCM